MSIKNYEIVKVTWHDAHTPLDNWSYFDEIEDDEEPLTVVHIGFLLPVGKGGKKNHISLTFGLTEDEALDTRIHIPRKMVVGIERLVSGGPRRLGRGSGVSKKGASNGKSSG